MMEGSQEEYYSINEIVSHARSFLHYLRKKFWLLLIATIAGACLGVLYYYVQKPKYEATSTFILEEKQGGMGGLSGLASQFGFDLGSMMGGGSIFAGDNILEILKSRNIIQNVLLSRVDSSDSKNNKKLADLFLEFSGWKEKWQNDKRLKDINFENLSSSSQALTLQQDSVLDLTHQELIKKHLFVDRVTKKGTVIKVSLISNNEVFSKLVSERIVNGAKDMYVQFKTNNTSSNVRRLEHKADSLLYLLNRKSYQTAGSIVIDANPGLKSTIVPSELNVRDKMVLQTLYTEVVKNLEVSRIALMQQTPIIQVLDSPTFPLENKKKKLLFTIFIGSLIFIFISFSYLTIQYLIKKAYSAS